jgi:hypothetical protein
VIKSCGIIKKESVESVTKWRFSPFCDQFTQIVHDPKLALPRAALSPSAKVFSELRIDDQLLLSPPLDKRVFAHCDIEAVMKRMGYVTTIRHNAANDIVLRDNERMVSQLANARQEEVCSFRNKGAIDQVAEHFLILCGFDDDPLEITERPSNFTLFGKPFHCAADLVVVNSQNNDLVLVCGDKSVKAGTKSVPEQGYLGQMMGELLQILAENRNRNLPTFRSVFAVRFVNYYVTAFRVDPDPITLSTLCDTRNVPAKKLRLLSSVAAPKSSFGLSLIDKAQRKQAVQLMANIREFIVRN